MTDSQQAAVISAVLFVPIAVFFGHRIPAIGFRYSDHWLFRLLLSSVFAAIVVWLVFYLDL